MFEKAGGIFCTPAVSILQKLQTVKAFVFDWDGVFNDGTKGGLPNWPEVVAELNKTKDLVNTIKSVLTGWTVVPGDGGAALKAFAATQLAAKVAGVYENKEDLTVKH